MLHSVSLNLPNCTHKMLTTIQQQAHTYLSLPLLEPLCLIDLPVASHCHLIHNLLLRPDSLRPCRKDPHPRVLHHFRHDNALLPEPHCSPKGRRHGYLKGGQGQRVLDKHGLLCGDERRLRDFLQAQAS